MTLEYRATYSNLINTAQISRQSSKFQLTHYRILLESAGFGDCEARLSLSMPWRVTS
jgi:hypothetical protein